MHGKNDALVVLACAAFVVGTAEFIVVGVLDVVSRDLGVPISVAGYLVTAYALGISIGAPIVMALTARLDRRLLLIGISSVFSLATLVSALASDLNVLVAARFAGGTTHGLFVGVASVVAASLVPPTNQGRAMSMVFGGIAVATILGVPLGTLVAQLLGWRAVFAGVALLGVVAMLAIVARVPTTTNLGAGGLSTQVRGALAPRVLLMLLVGAMLMGGQFAAFTYLVPYLQEVTGVPRELISAFLLIYGVASAVGAFVGGHYADRNAGLTLITANLLLLPALGLLYFFGDHQIVAAPVLAAWGVIGFGLVPALQLRVVNLAGCGRDLAATLSASAANAGVAAGSLLGGRILERHGVGAVVLISIAVCASAVPLTWGTQFLKPVARPD